MTYALQYLLRLIVNTHQPFLCQQTAGSTLALYFLWPDATSPEPHSTADLIPALQVKEILAQRGMKSLLPTLSVQSVYTRVRFWA